ncbi:MAG: hypothetical protein GXP35_09975 [Actinobacteria bacterium]|nr:hypothetical protein [Actinomycetota bacterium]
MTLKTLIDRLQVGALGLAAIFVLLLFTGWPGAGDGNDPSTPSETTEFPGTQFPETSEAPEPSEG